MIYPWSRRRNRSVMRTSSLQSWDRWQWASGWRWWSWPTCVTRVPRSVWMRRVRSGSQTTWWASVWRRCTRHPRNISTSTNRSLATIYYFAEVYFAGFFQFWITLYTGTSNTDISEGVGSPCHSSFMYFNLFCSNLSKHVYQNFSPGLIKLN